ncbi:MAG: hypothetical protein M1833_006426 [Piccolia ochrophora]|nr:MAG: hypothetical protein M1833_006426 [Piccolia ochrophora]
MDPLTVETSSPKRHSRNLSTDDRRSTRLRSATKGPLDGDDPLSPSLTSEPSSATSPSLPSRQSLTLEYHAPDLSFLCRPEIYHPLTNLDIPASFLTPAPPPSSPIPTLLAKGHFVAAAQASATLLTTPPPPPASTLFSTLYARLASLTLLNLTSLAATESKALGDLSDPVYRNPVTGVHLVPWELQVLAVRLQAIGWGDARRVVGGYFELAREARKEAVRREASAGEKQIWRDRLTDLGLRIASALVEMGDLEAAARFLSDLRPSSDTASPTEQDDALSARLALVYLTSGDVASARRCLPSTSSSASQPTLLTALTALASSDFPLAITHLRTLLAVDPPPANAAVLTQNLAVCLLYTGEIAAARRELEALVERGDAFHALTFNLATVYELCSEKARGWKVGLAEKVAGKRGRREGGGLGEMGNADFKL